MQWPIEGINMYGWIVAKDRRSAAALVKAGCAEYVLPGTQPPPMQLEWVRSIQRGMTGVGG